MEMQLVISSNIKAIGFEEDKMRVEFNSGATYEATASQSDFDTFMVAKSKGQHFNKILKKAFVWTKIEKKG
jgi:hypothetical protein